MFVLKHENVVRREDDRLLRGSGLYTADREHAGLLQAVVLRAPFAHARIAGADAAAARAMPGVAGVFLAADLDAEVIAQANEPGVNRWEGRR
jgi:aerobic carbon-monoxide dehydrogenase large subunit